MMTRVVRGRRIARRQAVLSLGLLVLLLPASAAEPARAQSGTAVSGQVVDAGIGEPIPSALVELRNAEDRLVRSTVTDTNGRFRLSDVPAGTYTVVVTTVGYETRRMEGIRIGAAPVTLDRIGLTSRAFEINPVVVTASREREKVLEAPASIHTVSPIEIQEQSATTPVDYVKGLPGVDVVSNGLSQHNVVARGFNNVFSGALFVLTDYRWASVPSLRFNAYNLIPQTNEDIERIEFVLGPASALYGPNVDKGVMHILTKSPLQSQETSVSITGGERKLFQGTVRHAGLFTENIGYKISGQYFRGQDWRFTDPVEAENREVATSCLANFVRTNPTCFAFSPNPQDSILPDPDRLRRIGLRDFQQERYSGTARVDAQLTERTRLDVEGGATVMGSSIEMTGIGAAQADQWTYSYAQARLTHDHLFAQGYINLSDAGDTYTLRAGDAIQDNSMLYVGQIQHATDLNERQRFVYGADLIRTVPRTNGTITGRNEGDDNITEVGAYVQSETAVSPKLDLVGAGRIDWHSVVDELVFSPRIGGVYKPEPGQNFRLTYNRAFSQPTTNNLFLDLEASPTLGPFTDFAVRATGVPSTTGFRFRRDCGPPFEVCMHSPFVADPTVPVPVDATQFWDAAVTGLERLVEAGRLTALGTSLDPDLEALLRSLDPRGEVSTVLRPLDPTTASFGDTVLGVNDVDPIRPTITNTVEAGYKGIIADRLLLGIDLYYTRVEDFIGPLLVETPSAFLEPGTLGSFLADTLQSLGLSTNQILSVIGGLRNVPLGTVTPENSPGDPSDLLVTYRNFGSVNIWGSDLAASLLLNDEFSISASYSYVSRNFFRNLAGITDVALNSPRNKASGSAQYRNAENGLSAELRGRYVDSYPVNSGAYIGRVESFVIFDANLKYDLPFSFGTSVNLSAYNIFDNRHKEIVGAPELGRLMILRLRQTF